VTRKVNRLLRITAVVEATTGLVFMVSPSIVGQLVLGADVSGVATPLARVAGLVLLSFGLACWPGHGATSHAPALRGMLSYNLLITLYLTYLGVGREWVGPFLWPVVALHAVLTLLFARAWLKRRQTAESL
jgi:hypothetical protein